MANIHPRWDLVVFDCDGVILDSKPVVFSIMETMGFTGIEGLLRTMFWDDPASHLKSWGLEALKFLMSLDQKYDQVVPFDGMVDLIRLTRSNWPELKLVVLSSNSTTTIARRLESQEVGLGSVFHQIVGRDALSQFSGKSQKLTYLKADLQAERCCFVGDTRSDLLAGLAADVATVGVTWGGFHDQEDLQTIEENANGKNVRLFDDVVTFGEWLVGST